MTLESLGNPTTSLCSPLEVLSSEEREREIYIHKLEVGLGSLGRWVYQGPGKAPLDHADREKVDVTASVIVKSPRINVAPRNDLLMTLRPCV